MILCRSTAEWFGATCPRIQKNSCKQDITYWGVVVSLAFDQGLCLVCVMMGGEEIRNKKGPRNSGTSRPCSNSPKWVVVLPQHPRDWPFRFCISHPPMPEVHPGVGPHIASPVTVYQQPRLLTSAFWIMSIFVLTNAFHSFLTLIHNPSLMAPAGLGTNFSVEAFSTDIICDCCC